MTLQRRGVGRALLALGAAVLLCSVLAVAPTDPAAAGGRQICGTLVGTDGRYVNAAIGIALMDAGGNIIQYDGDGVGYSLPSVRLNPGLPADGGNPAPPNDRDWCFTVPDSRAVTFLLEVYPRNPGNDDDYSHYGGASRRPATIGGGVSGVQMRLPVTCEDGGETGSLRVKAFVNGQAATITRFLAVSQGPPPNNLLGFHFEPEAGASPRTYPGLAPDQRYSVQVTFGGGHRSIFADVAIRPCQTTEIWATAGSLPAGTPKRWSSKPISVNGSYYPVPGDFTGDGNTDIFWYGSRSAPDYLWTSNGNGTSFTSRPFPVSGAYRPTAGDYDGDGDDDIYWFAPGSARDYKWYFQDDGASYQSRADPAVGHATTWPFSDDFDGNGRDDILFYASGAADSIWRHSGNGSHTSRSISIGANINVATGDINGDFKADIYMQSRQHGGIALYFGRADGSFLARSDGTGSTYRPVMGDLSCDLRADVIQYQPGSGGDSLWRGRSSLSPYFAKEGGNLGISGVYAYPFTGDFDGNGCADVMWYQPGTGSDALWLNSQVGWTRQQ